MEIRFNPIVALSPVVTHYLRTKYGKRVKSIESRIRLTGGCSRGKGAYLAKHLPLCSLSYELCVLFTFSPQIPHRSHEEVNNAMDEIFP